MNYQVTKMQQEKLLKVLPTQYHRGLKGSVEIFNALPKSKQVHQYCHLYCSVDSAVNLFMSSGIIHLEVAAFSKEYFFFRMDSNTDIVIHEVAL